MLLGVFGLVGVGLIAMTPIGRGVAQGVPSGDEIKRLQAMAPKGGVVMLQDERTFIVYDSEKQTMVIVEKNKWVESVPLTWVVNTRTCTARHVSPAK